MYKISVSLAFCACHSNSTNKSLERGDCNSVGLKGWRMDKEARVLAHDSWTYGEEVGG